MSDGPDVADQAAPQPVLTEAHVRRIVFQSVLVAGAIIATVTFLVASILPAIGHYNRYTAAARNYDRIGQCRIGHQLQEDWERFGLSLSDTMRVDVESACASASRPYYGD